MGGNEIHRFLGQDVVLASARMREVLELAERYARTKATVLIEGESGSGKEIVARALHHFSARCEKPWVDLNCAALPDDLMESELFGYEKGAFTGAASQKQGLFELAEGGTLLLDEIGELDARLQVKLLRVLDCGQFYRVGGLRKVSVNVRVLAATNRNLREAVERGEFRKDLYHRLAQLTITVPPLRERIADILPLAGHFRGELGIDSEFSPEVCNALEGYHWPGNVRELRNVVTASCLAATDGIVRRCHLPPQIVIGTPRHEPAAEAAPKEAEEDALSCGEPAYGGLKGAERKWILKALREAQGCREDAARILGISSRTLRRKLRQYREDFRDDAGGANVPAISGAAS